jgi:hypothetical protein
VLGYLFGGAIKEHLLGAGDVATLERHGRKPAVGPLVQRGEFIIL